MEPHPEETPDFSAFSKMRRIPLDPESVIGRELLDGFAGIGPQPGSTDYTSAVTANNYETGKAEGSFVCKLAKDRGGNKIGMLSLPQDRENAQKYLKGAQEAFELAQPLHE